MAGYVPTKVTDPGMNSEACTVKRPLGQDASTSTLSFRNAIVKHILLVLRANLKGALVASRA